MICYFLSLKSFISGITLLGLPTEVYLHGIQYVYVSLGVLLMGFVMSYFYLPVFHDLHITSTYEVYFNFFFMLFLMFFFSNAKNSKKMVKFPFEKIL